MKRLERNNYLDWLIRWKDQHIIKVVTGVRRCGKSTLFEIYQGFLRDNGVTEDQIISINFENLDFEALTDYHALYDYVKCRLIPDKTNYVFLDEIQHVGSYEKAVDSLFLIKNCDIYITGSNGYLLSGELATLLTGRFVELSMMPLSFKEFCGSLNDENMTDTEKLNRYIKCGSFPYTASYGFEEENSLEYMRGIYNTILLNDIVKRMNISDVNALEAITRFLMYNIGNLTSISNIANTLTSNRLKTDPKTAGKYIRGLTDSLLFYEARRYNIKGKRLLNSVNKYYVCDVALRNLLVRSNETDMGHILENLVYLELRRRYPEVYVGQANSGREVDFVAIKDGNPVYYQVSLTTLEEKTLARELAPLREIDDNYPKYLLTLDNIFDNVSYDGIQKLNVVKWLLL